MSDRYVQLRPREHELVPLLARGLTEADCAEEMGISARTVKGIADTLRFKLGVKTRREIPMAYWRVTGIDPFPVDEEVAT